MTLENYLAEAGALAGLAGVSLAALVQLLASNDSRRLTTAGIVLFSAASAMFLYSLIVAVLSFSAAAELNRVPSELDNLKCRCTLDHVWGDLCFCRGIGLAGSIRSRSVGILTTIFAIISACLITYAIGLVISLFM